MIFINAIIFMICWLLVIITFPVMMVVNIPGLVVGALLDAPVSSWMLGGTPLNHYKVIRGWFRGIWLGIGEVFSSIKSHISNEIKGK